MQIAISLTFWSEDLWEYAYLVHMCFADLEKVYDCMPHNVLCNVLQEQRVLWLLLHAFRSLSECSNSWIYIIGTKLKFRVGIGKVCLVSTFVYDFHGQDIKVKLEWCTVWEAVGDIIAVCRLRHCSLQIMLYPNQDLLHILKGFSTKCKTAEM